MSMQIIQLHGDLPKRVVDTAVQAPASGSRVSDIGWKDNDSNPTSGSLTFGSGSLLQTTDYLTPVTPAVSTNWSIGIDFGTYSGSIASVGLYDSGSSGGFYNSGSCGSLRAYLGNDKTKYSPWLNFSQLTRAEYSGSVYLTEVKFPSPVPARFIKLNAYAGPLKDLVGNEICFSKVTVTEHPDEQVAVSGSIYTQFPPIFASEVLTGRSEVDARLGTVTETMRGGIR